MDPFVSFPDDIKTKFYQVISTSIETAQKELTDQSQGVYYVDFKRYLAHHLSEFDEQFRNHIIIETALVNTFTNDKFYANYDFSQFSICEIEGYHKWSDIVKNKFRGYKFSNDTKIFENDGAEVIGFDTLVNQLLSKIDEPDEEKKEQIDTHSIFLDGKQKVPKVVYASFMRSGSTLMRKYLESITSVVTGSIYPNFFTMNFSLLASGFKAETYLNDQVWIFKAHHPFLFSQVSNPPINKAIVCIRNPLDVIASFMQLRLTQTHTKSCQNKFHKDEPTLWNEYILDMSRLWNDYNEYWHNVAVNKVVPVFFFRFEDLITNPKAVLTDLFCFLLGVECLKGTFVEKRIDEVIGVGEEGKTLYKPRQGGINKNKALYSDEQIKMVQERCEKYIRYFRYDGSDHDTNIFTYQEENKEKDFISEKKEQINWCIENNGEIEKTEVLLNSLYENAPQLGAFLGPEIRAELLKLQAKSYVKY